MMRALSRAAALTGVAAVARRGEWSGARRGRALKWAPKVNKQQGHGDN